MDTNEDISVEADYTLAQVVEILEKVPINGADNIELAKVLGWNVVVKKEENYKVGDLAVYFSIGSILPKDVECFAFLEGKPLKTIKLRGVLSQGLLVKMDKIKESYSDLDPALLILDQDLTKVLGITKYVSKDESHLYRQNNQNTKISPFKPFPDYVRKTDEKRIQSAPKILKLFEDRTVVLTQKYDGTSTTIIWKDGSYIICGRNSVAEANDVSFAHYFEVPNKLNLEEKLKEYHRNIAIQGETIGPKINCNRHNVKDISFHVFNIYDIDNCGYLEYEECVEICEKFGLCMVKLLYYGPMKQEWLIMDNLLKLADEQKYSTGMICEGIVIKTDQHPCTSTERFSLKVISNKFLLKYKQ
jgi:RNA ligase (TIGR02306 family)